MTEHLLGRIENLERRLRRWRLATFVLALLLVCSVAVGGTMNLLLMLELPDRREMMMLIEQERAAREQETAARRRAEQSERALRAWHKAEPARRQAEAAKQ